MNRNHKYTSNQINFLKDVAPGRSYALITELFNKEFELYFSQNRIKSTLGRHGIRNGINQCFPKGNSPYNKGTKGLKGENITSFKKGNMPHNAKPIGSEIIDRDGYTHIKIANPNKWQLKQILEWEKAKGAVPQGHAIIFADQDRTNFKIDNLLLVSRSELLIMNKKKLINKDADLTHTGSLIAKTINLIHKKGKQNNA